MKHTCCLVLICLMLLGGAAFAGGDFDPIMDKIYDLGMEDYQGLFAMTGEVDGAYTDALAHALSDSFFYNPEAFLIALGRADADLQDSVAFLVAYDTRLRHMYATHPFLILEDELSIAAGKPGVDAAVVQRFLDGIAAESGD